MQTESNPASPTTPPKAPASYRERFRQHMLLRNFSPKTSYRYLRHVESLFAWLGPHRPRRVERQDVVDFLVMLLEEQELAASSRANVLAAVKVFFNQVVQKPEVVAGIPWPKRERFLPYIPSTDELSALFAAVESLHLRVMLELALACGLRVSELCSLQVTDIERYQEFSGSCLVFPSDTGCSHHGPRCSLCGIHSCISSSSIGSR